MIGIGINIGVGVGGGGPAGGSTLDATKVALLGDSFVALAYQNVNTTFWGDDGATGWDMTVDAGHALLEGGRFFGTNIFDPTVTGVRTVETFTDVTVVGGQPYAADVLGTNFAHLQRHHDWGSWVNYWNALEGWPVDYVMAGIGGARAANLDKWISEHVVPSDAAWVILSAGHNDIVGDGASDTAVIGYLDAALADLVAAGRKVVICTIPPFSSASSERTYIEAVNTHIRGLSFGANLVLLDVYAELDDGAGGQGANMFTDTIHPSPLGCMAIATAAQTALAGIFADRDILPTVAAPGIVTNPTLTGTGGTIGTGTWTNTTVADNWTLQSNNASVSGTLSKETRGDGHGDNQVVSSIAGKDANRNIRLTSASAHTAFNAGDRVYGVAEVTIESMADMRYLRLAILAVDADSSLNTSASPAAAFGYSTNAHAAAEVSNANRTMVLKTGEITLANAVTNLQLEASLWFAGPTAGGTFKVGRATIMKVE